MALPESRRAAGHRRARPEFHQLEVFLAVVEAGSFSAAARRIGRTQPAVSQAIDRLEEVYEAKLFERRPGTPLTLTPIGEAILPSARIILRTMDHHMALAIAASRAAPPILTIGLSHLLDSDRLQGAVRRFAAANPDAALRFVEGSRHDLLRLLNEFKVDLLIGIGGHDRAGDHIMHERLWEERLAVVMREDHPLARKQQLDCRDLPSLSLLVQGSPNDFDCDLVILVERLADRRLMVERHDVSRPMLMNLVAAGLGQTIAFSSMAAASPGLAVRPVAGEQAVVTIEAIWRRGRRNALRGQLLDLIRQTVRQANAQPKPIEEPR
jgi:DNA-binding transcriptional LysR family regulator